MARRAGRRFSFGVPIQPLLPLAAVIALALAGWQLHEGAAQDQKPSVSVGSATVEKGGTTTVTLSADKMPSPGLDVWVIDVDYTPGELSVAECETLAAPLTVSCMDYDENVRFMGSGTQGGITGHVDIGAITFQAGQTNTTSIIRVTLHVLSDDDGTNLIPTTNTVDGAITITGDVPTEEPTEPLPGLDDTPSPTPTVTPGGPTFTPSPTSTPTVPTATPTATSTPTPVPPGSATIEARKLWDTYDYEGLYVEEIVPVPGWLMSLYDGAGCDGLPRATAAAPALFAGLEPGTYSVAEEIRADWVPDGPLTNCVTVVVEENSFEVVDFYNLPLHNGDVNKDGVANTIDTAILLQFVVGRLSSANMIEALGGSNVVRLDVNEDFTLDSRDALIVLQHDAGLIDVLPLICVVICAGN